ncbi:MAG: SLBB domain-containing protein [Candidatus Cloacimonetes bacterium]|nr:SLBB domain-containing protein [Candidatus Cloacimonadota bacterium]
MKTKLLIAALLFLTCLMAAQTIPQLTNQVLISVNVTGFVANPGTYQMSPLSRISDAIKVAGSVTPTVTATQFLTPQQVRKAERDSLFENFQGLRRVRLTRGGETKTFDLLRFNRTGDLSQNPLLKDGDLLQLPSLDTSVTITGEVYFPGEYEYVPGDRLADILALAQGFTLAANRETVSIYRYRENSPEFEVLLIDLRERSAEDIVLRPHDRISITADTEHRRDWKITVEGNVKAPGEYYIDENTTLYEILVRCGGPSSRGNLRSAIYANRGSSQESDPELERLMQLEVSDLTAMEYRYMLNRIRQYPGRYSIDVSRTWESQGEEANPVLRDGDYLYVPLHMDMVEVSGQVVHPGLIPWVEGQNYEYYVQQAGGYTNNKRWLGTRIIRATSGNWVKPSKKLALDPGDTVYVSENDTYDTWTRFKDIMLIATQVITIFLGVRTLTN